MSFRIYRSQAGNGQETGGGKDFYVGVAVRNADWQRDGWHTVLRSGAVLQAKGKFRYRHKEAAFGKDIIKQVGNKRHSPTENRLAARTLLRHDKDD